MAVLGLLNPITTTDGTYQPGDVFDTEREPELIARLQSAGGVLVDRDRNARILEVAARMSRRGDVLGAALAATGGVASSGAQAAIPSTVTVVQDGSGDYTSLQEAVAAANSLAASGQAVRVLIGSGTYVLDAPLDLTQANVTLEAASDQGVMIMAPASVSPAMRFTGDGATTPIPTRLQRVCGVVIARSGPGLLVETAGTPAQAPVIRFECCLFLGGAPGFSMQSAHSVALRGCFAAGVGLPTVPIFDVADASGAATAVVSDCAIFDAGQVARVDFGCTFLLADAIVIAPNGVMGVEVVDGSAALTSCQMSIFATGAAERWGLSVDGAGSDATATDCQFNGCGVRVGTTSGPAAARVFASFIDNVPGSSPSVQVGAGGTLTLACTSIADMGVGAYSIAPGGVLRTSGGSVPVDPSLPSPGLVAASSDFSPSGDALVVYNADTPSRGLRLQGTFTPASTADGAGVEGSVCWDDDFVYVKTSVGWKRTALATF